MSDWKFPSDGTVSPHAVHSKAIAMTAIELVMRYPQDAADWCGGHLAERDGAATVMVRTTDGLVPARFGDWILRDERFPEGKQFYPLPPGVFEALFEVAEGDPE